MPGESYQRRLRLVLLYLCYVVRALVNSLVCCYYAVSRLFVVAQFCLCWYFAGDVSATVPFVVAVAVVVVVVFLCAQL